jgi:hypothetical protein
MESFALLYIFYIAKLGFQFSIYLIWNAHKESSVITYLAACVVLLAVAPAFHTIVHIYKARPLSDDSVIAYMVSRYGLWFLRNHLSLTNRFLVFY